MLSSSGQEWYRNSLLQFCGATVCSVVLTVFAAMLTDLRWLLVFAWPFAIVAVWEFARIREASRIGAWTLVGAGLSAAALGLLYWQLTPKPDGDDLVGNFHIPDPLQVGTSSLAMSYRFQNASARAVLVAEIGLIEVFSRDKVLGGKATDVCLSPSLGWVDIFPDYNDIARGMPTAMWDSHGAWMEGTSFVLRNSNVLETPVTIQPMGVAVVSATFNAKFPDLTGEIATVALCPVIKTYDKGGHGITAICRSIAMAISNHSGETSEALVTGAPPAGRILPPATKSDCQILITPHSRRDSGTL